MPGANSHQISSPAAQGWSPNQKYRDCGQQTALHISVQHGHTAAAHLLVTAGACLDPVDRDLQTPLMLAAARAQNEVLKYLVTAGAALDAKVRRGRGCGAVKVMGWEWGVSESGGWGNVRGVTMVFCLEGCS